MDEIAAEGQTEKGQPVNVGAVLRAETPFMRQVKEAREFRDKGGLVVEPEKVAKWERELADVNWTTLKSETMVELITGNEKKISGDNTLERLVDKTVENPLALAQVTLETTDKCCRVIGDHDLFAWSAELIDKEVYKKALKKLEGYAPNIFYPGISEEERIAIRRELKEGQKRVQEGKRLQTHAELQAVDAFPVGLNTISVALGVLDDTQRLLSLRQYPGPGKLDQFLFDKKLSPEQVAQKKDLNELRAYATMLRAIQAELAGKRAAGREAYAYKSEVSAAKFVETQALARGEAEEEAEKDKVLGIIQEVKDDPSILEQKRMKEILRERMVYRSGSWKQPQKTPATA